MFLSYLSRGLRRRIISPSICICHKEQALNWRAGSQPATPYVMLCSSRDFREPHDFTQRIMQSSVALYTALRRHANKAKKLEHKLHCNTGHPVVPLYLSTYFKTIFLYPVSCILYSVSFYIMHNPGSFKWD